MRNFQKKRMFLQMERANAVNMTAQFWEEEYGKLGFR
jgi:hypothetical protein